MMNPILAVVMESNDWVSLHWTGYRAAHQDVDGVSVEWENLDSVSIKK